jgi:hypothetical protein
MLSVYADGRVLSPSWSADGWMDFVARRLTPAGLAALRSALEGAAFAYDIEIPPTQAANSANTYTVSLDGRLARDRTTNRCRRGPRSWTAERWTHPERVLPATPASGSVRHQGRVVPGTAALPDFVSTQNGPDGARGGDRRPGSFGRLMQSFEDVTTVRGPVVRRRRADRAALVAEASTARRGKQALADMRYGAATESSPSGPS